MADSSLHSLTSTLASAQALTSPDASQQAAGNQPGATDANAAPPPPINGAPLVLGPDTVIPEVPVKRRPGRPKGSGKKQLDASTEPKPKRPVGRPRKDGLPAGSVGPRRPNRPRKRPPGSFASGGQSISAAFPGYTQSYPYPVQAQWRASVPPMGSLLGGPPPPPPPAVQLAFHIDPNLDRENWAELSRVRPDVFLSALVAALSNASTAAPPPNAGPSVDDAFRSHLASLTPASKNTPSIPTLYSVLKTFWLPSSPVYFSLTASASTARTPSDHRFLYWDPQPLVFNGIACPACGSSLINQGRISSGPIKVYDLGKPFFIIGCEYVCKSSICVQHTSADGRKFASTDASIIRALPPKLQDEFPAYLLQGAPDLGSGPDVWNWQGMGVSISLWNMVHACLRAGLRKEPIVDVVRAVQDPVKDESFRQMQMHMHMMPPPAPLPPQVPVSAPPALENQAQEEEEEEEENDEAAQVDGDLDFPKDPAEEYNEAWNANNGTGSQDSQNQAGPSTNVQAPPSASQGPPANGVPPPPPPGYQGYVQPYAPYAYPPYTYFQPGPSPPDPNAANPNLLKRTFSIVESSSDQGLSEPMQKRIRHCCKCGSNECKGKGGRAFCTNPCQDCGKLSCKGRNSKRPDRTCADAWP